jgi:hypothetical protein
MTPTSAYRHGYITRQQFIEAQWKTVEARRRFKERYPSGFSEGGAGRCQMEREEDCMSDVSHKLHRETEAARALRANLADLIAENEETAADFVEGETNLVEAIELAVKQMGEDEAAVEALARYSEKMKSRTARLKSRLERLRLAVASAMEQAGKKRIETPYGTVSRRTVPRTAIVMDEADIPTDYWKEQDPKLDRGLLTADLRAGKIIKGVTLSNGHETVTIRRD